MGSKKIYKIGKKKKKFGQGPITMGVDQPLTYQGQDLSQHLQPVEEVVRLP